MSLVNRFFGKRGHEGASGLSAEQAAADRERAAHFGAPAAQSAEERDAVRARMEAELQAQRERRLQA